MQRLNNKIALVTGAAQGIGAETAKLFSAHGAKVMLVDVLSDAVKKMADSIGSEYLVADVSDEASWDIITQRIHSLHGRLDILVNNAAITGFNANQGPQDPEHVSTDTWHHVHKVNLDSVFYGCKYAFRLMKQHGGSIVNISSRSGLVGIPAACAYASSKAAVRNHTKSVALYASSQGYNIRCNSLHPGAILTPMWDPMLGSDEVSRKQAIAAIAQDIPLGVMGEAQDVAYAALYLASDESKYLTGIELNIDGGMLAGTGAAPKPKGP